MLFIQDFKKIKFAKRISKSALIFVFLLKAPLSSADITGGVHDFTGQSWAQGKTCGICHGSQKSAQEIAPPGGWRSKESLSPDEKAGFAKNPRNLLCFSCHRSNSVQDPHDPGAGSARSVGPVGSVPSTPNVITAGTRGSICLHVVSRGSKVDSNCLKCHDIHSESGKHLLRTDIDLGSGGEGP